MEKRLKQQRNRLFLKVSVIITAVWLAVTFTYFAICLVTEKNSLENRELAFFSTAQQRLSAEAKGPDKMSSVTLNSSNLAFFKDGLIDDRDSQFVVIDRNTNKEIANTAYRKAETFSMHSNIGGVFWLDGYIDYNRIRSMLSDEQLSDISDWLEKDPGRGKRYELICSKYYYIHDEFIPREFRIALVSGSSVNPSCEEIKEVYLSGNDEFRGNPVYISDEGLCNVIPSDFLFGGAYNRDIISELPEKQRESRSLMISNDPFEYIVYASDYIYLNAYTIEDPADEDKSQYVENDTFYLIRYARKANLLKNCMNRLVIGAAVIFAFFLVIAFMLCIMIWRSVRAQLKEEQKRSEMTSALAHDIKTPLFIISGYAYSLKENIDPEEHDNYLDKIIEQTEDINAMIHSMLTLSKLENCAVTPKLSEFDLCTVVSGIIGEYHPSDGKTISFTHSGDNTIKADEEMIGNALQNLMENAIKYSLPDSVIDIELEEKTISIKNDCEPLTKAELKQIWQPYVRKDKSRHRKGNGLGLSIVRSILELHKVRYHADIENGRFVIRITFSDK